MYLRSQECGDNSAPKAHDKSAVCWRYRSVPRTAVALSLENKLTTYYVELLSEIEISLTQAYQDGVTILGTQNICIHNIYIYVHIYVHVSIPSFICLPISWSCIAKMTIASDTPALPQQDIGKYLGASLRIIRRFGVGS